MNNVEINQYIEGVLTASLGTSLILWGLPSLAASPKLRRGMTKAQAFKVMFRYIQFFLSCTLLGYAPPLLGFFLRIGVNVYLSAAERASLSGC